VLSVTLRTLRARRAGGELTGAGAHSIATRMTRLEAVPC
jgi:hypothetical protein